MFAATKSGKSEAPIDNLVAHFPLTTDISPSKPLLYPYAQSSGTAGTFYTSSAANINAPPTGTGRCMQEPSTHLYLGGIHPTDTSFFSQGNYTLEFFHLIYFNGGEKASATSSAGDTFGTNQLTKTYPWTPNFSWGTSGWAGGYYYNNNLYLGGGTWYHICVMSRSNNTIGIYLDGVIKDSQSVSAWNKKGGWLNLFPSGGWISYTTEVRLWNVQKYDSANSGTFTVNNTPLY